MERTENVEKLMTTIEKLGFSREVQNQVKEHMNNGLSEFAAYESMPMGQDLIDYRLNFSLSKVKENHNVYLNSIDVVLDKAVIVPHKMVLGFDTTEAETLLQNKPREEMVNPFNREEFDKLMFVHNAKVEEKMKFLSEHAPEIFNALQVKYKPEIDVAISPEMQKQQEQLQNSLQLYNTFSTYYNLTKLEMYNAMNGGAIFKTLFKVNTNAEQASQSNDPAVDNKYRTWIQVDFQKRREDGRFEMKMFHEKRDFNLREVLREYNFKETNDRFDRQEVAKFLQKGSKFLVTNLGDMGEKEVLIRANPEFKNIDIFKLNGEAIRSGRMYLKNPMFAEVSNVVSLKKGDGAPRTAMQVELTAENIQEKANKFQLAKNSINPDQKKSARENKPTEKEAQNNQQTKPGNNQAQNGTIERRTRNSARTMADTAARQSLKR